MAVNCKVCGKPNADNVRFCAACGASVTPNAQAANAETGASGTSRARTMLFKKAPQIPAADEKKAMAMGTILGAPAVKPPIESAPKAKPAQVSTAQKKTESAPMVAMATAKPNAAKPATAKPAATVGNRAQTVIGLPSANADEVAAAIEAAKKDAEKKDAASKSSATDAADAKVMNVAAAKANPDTTATPAQTNVLKTRQIQQPIQEATLQEFDEPSERPATPRQESDPPPAHLPADAISRLSEQPMPAASSSHVADKMAWSEGEWADTAQSSNSNIGIIIPIIVAAVVIVGLVAFILFKFVFSTAPSFQPQILASQDGETLTVILDLPEAPPGSTIQFNEQNIPLAGGKVQFLLRKKQMRLGANLVKVVLNEPNESPKEISFPIMLRHVATNDFSKLQDATPSIDVKFEVAGGFSIKVNGQPCPLTEGTCLFNLNVAAKQGTEGKNLQYAIPFELIDNQGNADPGQHIVTVPTTSFQLDRPAANAVVDSPEITVAGSAVPGAIVTVGGKRIEVGDAGFSTTIPLEKIGVNEINVVVTAPESAPSSQKISITRVDDLSPYIDSWTRDLDTSLNFARLSRDTNAHAGKKIQLRGRIININTERGVTAFLMYVDKGCPRGGQCGVYVVFRGETEAGLQSMVDVFGTVRGTHDVNFAGGAQKTLPAIDATYVVEADSDEAK